MKKNIGYIRILKLIIPYFLVVGMFQWVSFLLMGLDISQSKHVKTIYEHLTLTSFTFIGNLLIIWIFVKYIDKEPFINIGFQTKGRLKEFITGFFISFMIMLLAFFSIFLAKISLPIVIHFDFYKIILTTIIFFIAAITEETLCRGYILKNLTLSFNKYTALGLSSLFFAILHLANPNMSFLSFLDLFIGGYFLGLSYIYTKNLWFPIALHFSWNLFQTFFGFNVSGQDFYSIVEFKINKPNLLNGGDFGFEGSILSIITQLFFITLIFFYYKKQEKLGKV